MFGYAKASIGIAVGTTTVVTGRAGLTGVIVQTDGTNAATIDIYDNTAGSGTKVFSAVVNATAAAIQRAVPFMFVRAVKAEIGLTVVLSGTGATASVYYV
jgi:hypothetical protein